MPQFDTTRQTRAPTPSTTDRTSRQDSVASPLQDALRQATPDQRRWLESGRRLARTHQNILESGTTTPNLVGLEEHRFVALGRLVDSIRDDQVALRRLAQQELARVFVDTSSAGHPSVARRSASRSMLQSATRSNDPAVTRGLVHALRGSELLQQRQPGYMTVIGTMRGDDMTTAREWIARRDTEARRAWLDRAPQAIDAGIQRMLPTDLRDVIARQAAPTPWMQDGLD